MGYPAFAIPLALLFALELPGQPFIDAGGVVNAASYIPPGLPSSGVAQGSLFVIFGSRLGPSTLAQAPGLPLSAQLEGVSVEVRSGGEKYAAPLIYVSSRQVAAVMPSRVPAGAATVVVSNNGTASPPAEVQIVKTAFGVFTQNQCGGGPAVAQNYLTAAELPQLNSMLRPATPGQTVVLWGTGLGPISADDAAKPPVGDLDVPVEVLVANKTAQVTYKGRSTEFPGLDQINFIVPPDLRGCHLPLVVRTGSVVSNYSTISIAPRGATCSDPTTIPATIIEKLNEKGTVTLSTIELRRLELTAPGKPYSYRIDEGMAFFFPVNRETAGRMLPLTPYSVPLGCCTVYFNRIKDTTFMEPILWSNWYYLLPGLTDAGTGLNLSGPAGKSQLRGFMGRGGYYAHLGGYRDVTRPPLPFFIEPGNYSIDNGNGGLDIGGFTASGEVLPIIHWTNMDDIREVDRAKDLTVTWTGGDASKEYVLIAGTSPRSDRLVQATFLCAERVDAGKFTVPASVLSSLPVTTPPRIPSFEEGLLLVSNVTLPTAGGFSNEQIDFGFFHVVQGPWSMIRYK